MRPYLRLRYLLPAGLVALIAGAVLSFTPEFRPISDQLARRYGERDAAATAARQQAAAAAARAAEEQRQRQAAQDAAQRLASGYDTMADEFRRIVRVRRPPVLLMVQNLNAALQNTAAAAHRPEFYQRGPLHPEDIASIRPCSDPAGTMDLWNRDGRRNRNILACGIYLSVHSGEIPEPVPQVTMALLQRMNDPAEAGHYPFQTIITYIWLQYLVQSVNQAQPPGDFPPLNDGEGYNLALFRNTLPPGFAADLIATANDGEKLDLNDKIYPDLRRLAELGSRLALACQAMHRLPCLSPAGENRTL